jgi:hypothetical protein
LPNFPASPWLKSRHQIPSAGRRRQSICAQYDFSPMKGNISHNVFNVNNANKCNNPIETVYFGQLPYIQLDPHTWSFIVGGNEDLNSKVPNKDARNCPWSQSSPPLRRPHLPTGTAWRHTTAETPPCLGNVSSTSWLLTGLDLS